MIALKRESARSRSKAKACIVGPDSFVTQLNAVDLLPPNSMTLSRVRRICHVPVYRLTAAYICKVDTKYAQSMGATCMFPVEVLAKLVCGITSGISISGDPLWVVLACGENWLLPEIAMTM